MSPNISKLVQSLYMSHTHKKITISWFLGILIDNLRRLANITPECNVVTPKDIAFFKLLLCAYISMDPLQFFVFMVTPIYILISKDLELEFTNRKEHAGCVSGCG